MKILVIGARGFLGSELCKVLSERGHKVLRGVKRKYIESEIEIPLFKIVTDLSENSPELVIDVSNRYISEESEEAKRIMSETIIGISETISKSNEIWKVPIIQASSYLQYCPAALQPWNHYSFVRNESLKLLQNSANRNGQGFFEFILHDTYGEKSRGKFLDLCLEAIKKELPVAAGDGKSIINLTHINDICNFIADQIPEGVFDSDLNYRWDIKSSDTYNLKMLVQLLEQVSGKNSIVEWGKFDNPRREVLEIWDIPGALSSFKNKTIFKDWIYRKISMGL